MPEIAILNRSRLSPADAAFHAEALRIQMQGHFAPAYQLQPWNVVLYSDIPTGADDVYPIGIVDAIGVEGILGDHSDPLGTPVGEALDPGGNDATTPSHETCELRGDPTCEEWRPWPTGGDVAYEACDAVEGDRYAIPVTLFSETRRVLVSNFVLPSWYQADAPPPYDYMGMLDKPCTMSRGGYLVLRSNDGKTSQIFGATGPTAHHARNLADPRSRLNRRLAVGRR